MALPPYKRAFFAPWQGRTDSGGGLADLVLHFPCVSRQSMVYCHGRNGDGRCAMANVHCQSCGRTYDYEKYGCCPNCGAYNRRPRREWVDVDGTVHHGARKQEKVCYEKRPVTRRRSASRSRPVPPGKRTRCASWSRSSTRRSVPSGRRLSGRAMHPGRRKRPAAYL